MHRRGRPHAIATAAAGRAEHRDARALKTTRPGVTAPGRLGIGAAVMFGLALVAVGVFVRQGLLTTPRITARPASSRGS